MLETMSAQDADYRDLIRRNLSDRAGIAERSEARLNDLKGRLDTALFQGKRRTAAVIAQAMQAEGQTLSGIADGALPDPRRNMAIDPNAPANDAKIAAEAGQQAAAALQAINGKGGRRVMQADYPIGTDQVGAPITAKIAIDDQGNEVYNPFSKNQQGGSQLPAGAVRIAGYDRKTGRPVYEDAEGNPVIEE